MKIIPLSNQILCEGVKRSTKSGILLGEEYEDYYRVLAVGSEIQEVKKADFIIIIPHTAHQYEDYLIVSEDNVIAKVIK